MARLESPPAPARLKTPARTSSGLARTVPALVGAFLVCSGAAGLIYQVIWVRLLGLSFGVTVYAVSTVLAAFMGGLAIGSILGGRVADRTARPLRAYGIVEVGIGLLALLTPAAFTLLQDLYRAIAGVADPTQAPLLAGGVRGVLAFALLLIPTALMGASLPLAVRGVRRTAEVEADSRAMGLLYALNTTGAIAGTLLAGYVLIGRIGISRTVLVAAAFNLAAGLGALVLSWLAREGERREVSAVAGRPATAVATHAAPADAPLPGVAKAAFWGFALSGAISLAYEVVWSRILAILFNTSVYGFILMLATVLLGIAVGSAVASAVIHRQPRARFAGLAFGWIEVGIGVAAVVSLAMFGVVYDLLAQLRDSGLPLMNRLLRTDTRRMVAMCVLTVLPAALLMGASFPVAARLWAAGRDALGARLGGIYAGNVAGAIVGSLAGGFVLVPLLGAHRSLLVLGALNVLLGVWLLLVAAGPSQRRQPVVAGVVSLLLVAWGVAQPPVHSQVFRQRYPDQELLWYHEGLENTASIARGPDGVRTVFTGARGQSNDEPGLVGFYRLMAHLGALVSPRAERALVVGMGSGVLAGALADHADMHVSIVELSEGMIAAVPFFNHTNGNLLSRPNVTLIHDDGRNYLLRTRQTYDIITADVFQPYDAGSNNLYSVEYFRLAARALSPDGVMVQWVPSQSSFEHSLVVRTFMQAFPYATLWLNADVLLGSHRPLRLDLAALDARLAKPSARVSLAGAGYSDRESVVGRFHADTEEIRRYAGEGIIITDDWPIFEYFNALNVQRDPTNLGGFSKDPRPILPPGAAP